MTSISRRELIVLAGTAGATAALSPIFAFASDVTQVTTSNSGALLSVVPSTDPSFLVRMNELFPNLLADPGFQQLLPVAHLVYNVGGTPIRAFSSYWTASTATTTQEKTIFHYFHPRGVKKLHKHMHWGRKGNKTRFTAKVPVSPTGAIQLLTPFFNWSPGYYSKHAGRIHWPALIKARNHSDFPVLDLASAGAAISMTINALLTHDFVASGPGAAELARIIQTTRNAEHDEAISALWCISTGAAPDAVKAHLLREASGVTFDIRPDSDLYYRVRQRQARVLVRRLKHAQWEQFLRTLEFLKKKRKTSISIASVAV